MTSQHDPRDALSGLSAVKLALMAKQARAQVGAITAAEPIAIVGMGCRFPGGADSPERYWALLRDGIDAVRPLPRDRWDVDAVYDPDPAAPGKASATHGGFLDQVDEFDAAFFGILGREAEHMDPQHRLFLEVAIEALDHAGLPRERLAGTRAGVFVASYYNDYAVLQYTDPDGIDGRTLTGTQHSVLANRLSYLLDLRGPSISVDTACSSSLVATHLACQSLRSGDSDVALAAGVSLMLSPDMMITLSKVGFMSPTGRCRTFDAGADGFVRGEGCGVVVLKRLSDAIAGDDRVLAVIRGSAVNQDGHSTVISAPSGLAQQELIRDALDHAHLAPERVGFVEAHGTATPLGDPIEVEALAATVGAPRADGTTCYLGSVKANIGHLEAAAGVAGLIKAALVLQHGEIPRQLHFERLNPHLSLDGSALAVADAHVPWPAGAEPRVAGVSGFGVGGTNAHVVLEEAPQLAPPTTASPAGQHLLALSARSAAALHDLAEAWVDHLAVDPPDLARLTATAGGRRSHDDHRMAVVGGTAAQLRGLLDRLVAGDPQPAVARGVRRQGGAPRVAFVFSGQGAQWAGMGTELIDREPVFREVLADLDTRFGPLCGTSLLAALAEPAATSRLDDTELAQPAIFAVQVALAALWRSWGIEPDAVVGHSIGEYAALHVAGVLSLDDAVRIVRARGRLMQQATGHGRMTAVGLTAESARELVVELGGDLSLAAVNGPRSVVLSGGPQAIDRAEEVLDRRGVSHRALPVSYAFHSAQMAPFQTELVGLVGPLDTMSARVAVHSTVTGSRIDHTAIDAGYVGRNLRDPVLLAPALDSILDGGVEAIVEVAPHPVLAGSIAECLADRGQEVPVLASLRRGRPERETMLRACAGLYAVGRTPAWEAVTGPAAPPVDLPRYPWQRRRYWLPDARPTAAAHRTAPRGEPAVAPWLADHQVGGHVVMPATGLLEALRQAAASTYDGHGTAIRDLVVHQPLVLDGSSDDGWRTEVSPDGDDADVAVWATGREGTPERCIASARAGSTVAVSPLGDAGGPWGEWHDDRDELYRAFADLGVRFGPAFRTLTRWRSAAGAAEGWLEQQSLEAPGERPGVHPTVLDGALQLCVLTATSADGQVPGALLLPVAVESYTVASAPAARLRADVRLRREVDGGSLVAAIRLATEEGTLVAALDGVRFAPADPSALSALGQTDRYEVRWHARPAPTTVGRGDGAWVVLADGERGDALVSALTAAGGRCLQLRPGPRSIRGDATAWTVGAGDGEAFAVALADPSWRQDLPLRGIVHAWALDAGALDGPSDDWTTTGSALRLAQALGATPVRGAPLWLVTNGAQPAAGTVSHPAQAGLWGLAAAIAAELPDLRCRVVDVEGTDAAADAASLVTELLAVTDGSARLALRGDRRLAPRLHHYGHRPSDRQTPGGQEARLEVAPSGTLDELAWRPFRPIAPGPDEALVRVQAAGLNFRDVLLGLGLHPEPGAPLGGECAGVVEAIGAAVTTLAVGDAVFGFAPAAMATHVTVAAAFLARRPAELSIADAAGLPVAFLTASLGLERIAELAPGDRVLVHAAAGGVGLAAVQVAQRRGAVVLATAGSTAKRDLLHDRGVAHVFDSRSPSFADDVLAATDGRGVDVVLNSLSGELIEAGLRTVAPGGWFLELGKRDQWSAERVAAVRPDIRYRRYDLGHEAQDDPGLVGSLLAELTAALADGTARPLPVRTFAFEAATDAFRWMAQARHVGKVVLRAPERARRTPADPLVHEDATYWVTGGAGALGARTARWLVDLGARHLVLTGRHAPEGGAVDLLDECRALGATVHFRVADAADASAMGAVRAEIDSTMPPLRGVVHAAGAIDDGLLPSVTPEHWQTVVQGKAHGARILDALTRDRELDFFVLYSSASVVLGPQGQAAYAAANAELDALAWARRTAGRHGLSVAWGQWSGAGMAVRTAAPNPDGGWSGRGLGWIDAGDGFAQLAELLHDDATYAAIVPIDWARFMSRLPTGVDRSFFRSVAPAEPRTADGPVEPPGPSAVVAGWRSAPDGDRRKQVVTYVAGRARHVLGAEDDLAWDERVPLKDVGLDSLMAVELRNDLTRALDHPLPATLLFDHPSLDALAAYLLDALELLPARTPSTPEAAPTTGAGGDDLTALSDEEAEALLLAELGLQEGAP